MTHRLTSLGRLVPTVLAALALTLGAASVVLALDPGNAAPELGLRDLNGQEVTLASLRGRVVVVDFWASWCEPCADSMPVYQRLHTQYGAQGLTVVGVSQDQRVENARQFVERHHLTFPVLFDDGHVVANRYRPSRMPTAFILDRTGTVRHVHSGYRAEDAARLEAEVRALLDAH